MTTTPITGETWGDEIDSVRAFLKAESEKPFAALREDYEAAHRDLLAALEGVSDRQAEFRPADGEGEDAWGIAEALRHIASIEVIMADRIRALGSGAPLKLKPTYAGYMEDVDSRRLSELRGIIGQSEEAILIAIREVEGQERLDTTDTHRRFGELNCRGWLAMQTLHVRDHTRQIGKIKAMEGYAAA